MLGILSSISDSGKIVLLGLSTVIDSGSGLNLARIVQKNPIDQLIYGSWFSMNNASRSEERRVGKECRSRWSPYH